MLSREKISKLVRSRKLYYFLIVLAIISTIPLFEKDPFIIYVLTLIAIFTIYSSSWNLLAYSGQGSLGHAAFLGIGGFSSSLLAINLGISPFIGLFVGGILSAGIGLLIGLACVRLKAWFLAMVTFGFTVIAQALVSQFDSITHGIFGFRTPLLVEPGIPFFYLAISTAAVIVTIIYAIMKSKVGLAFRAINENESEAKMIGINTARYKLLAFMISTFFAGLAGGLYAHFLRYINITVFVPENSFLPLMMAVIGGLGTIEGPIIGSIIIVSIESFLPNIDNVLQILLGRVFIQVSNVGPPLRFLGLGLFLVLVVILLPKGVASLIRKTYDYMRTSLK